MGTNAVRVTSDTQLVTQQEQDNVSTSLKGQLCSGDTVCETAVDAAVQEALPLQYEVLTDSWAALLGGEPTTEKVDTTALTIVSTAVSGGAGETWSYTVDQKEKSRTDMAYANDGTIDRFCQGSKSTYSTGLKVTYGGRSAWAPLYSYVEKIPYQCYSQDEIQAMMAQLSY